MSRTPAPAQLHPVCRAARSPRRRLAVTITQLVVALVVLAAAATYAWRALATRTPAVPAPDYWLPTGWRSVVPETHGFDSAILADGWRAMRQDDTQRHSGLVVQRATFCSTPTATPTTAARCLTGLRSSRAS
jgi:hypothetical protein